MKKFRIIIITLFLLSIVLKPAGIVSSQANIPSGATITSAVLSVYVYGTTSKQVEVHRALNTWTENTVTWNSFSQAYDLPVIGSFTSNLAGWYTVDVRATVQSWVDGSAPNYGFMLRDMPPPVNDLYTLIHSSEYALDATLRPKLNVCYTAPGISETCVTIQRAAGQTGEVHDTYIYSAQPNSNFGSEEILYVRLSTAGDKQAPEKQTLIRFDFATDNPDVSIIKYTNGQVANDPNGVDVPRIPPGQPVVWTYRVSNIGNVAVPRPDVVVVDNQPGVMPVFDSEMTGNGDTIFDPGEVWWYTAAGTAVNLQSPPDGVLTFPNQCTNGGVETPRTAYINQATVTIPGASATAQSSYCNPPRQLGEGYEYYLPILNNARTSTIYTPFRVTIGYEDLPVDMGLNDYDYNDWIIDINGTATFESLVSNRITALTMGFEPDGRGATLTHAFHVLFPANTFGSGGTYTLTTFGPTNAVISTQTAAFSAGSPLDLMIFPNTETVFPAHFSNTFEDQPMVRPQRTAEVRFDFATPIVFNFSDYDYTTPHAVGLFFDPFLEVFGIPSTIHAGDLRILNVPEIENGSPINNYNWPEEWIRIDRAYTDLTFVPANPPSQPHPDIIFPNGWWLNHNHCVVDDVPCNLTVSPVSPLDFSVFNK